MTPPRTLAALAVLPLVVAACQDRDGGAHATALNTEGYAALGAGDWQAATADFEAALDALGGERGAQFLRAQLGLMKAKAHTDAAAVVDQSLALATAGVFTAKEISMVGGSLLEAGAAPHAADLMDRAIESHFPESEHLALLKMRLVAAADSDPALTATLRGLGYLD